ncbi:uncharacterized protein LOC111710878 [Eurytemora carolleeae]|uniref:uncharacterized protein LOC111710878 n=1 Tax=Eurytemora carolleeae TaxID=1294199 RepID=UPI000C791689|nr:uncharacterized protein LOC111710878 [Eurytemora carolleeae]|eukprot:XP_023340820.1 uncharacterized protein LOC111710878 [Eurytemora affinis]
MPIPSYQQTMLTSSSILFQELQNYQANIETHSLIFETDKTAISPLFQEFQNYQANIETHSLIFETDKPAISPPPYPKPGVSGNLLFQFLMICTTIMKLYKYVSTDVRQYPYSRIGLELWGSRAIGEATHIQMESIKSKRKVVKMMLFVVIIFCVCWLPYHTYFILAHLQPSINHGKYIQDIYLLIYWLAMSNSMYNPMIYCYMNQRFRRGFSEVIHFFSPFKLCFKPRDTVPEEDRMAMTMNGMRMNHLRVNRELLNLSGSNCSTNVTPMATRRTSPIDSVGGNSPCRRQETSFIKQGTRTGSGNAPTWSRVHHERAPIPPIISVETYVHVVSNPTLKQESMDGNLNQGPKIPSLRQMSEDSGKTKSKALGTQSFKLPRQTFKINASGINKILPLDENIENESSSELTALDKSGNFNLGLTEGPNGIRSMEEDQKATNIPTDNEIQQTNWVNSEDNKAVDNTETKESLTVQLENYKKVSTDFPESQEDAIDFPTRKRDSNDCSISEKEMIDKAKDEKDSNFCQAQISKTPTFQLENIEKSRNEKVEDRDREIEWFGRSAGRINEKFANASLSEIIALSALLQEDIANNDLKDRKNDETQSRHENTINPRLLSFNSIINRASLLAVDNLCISVCDSSSPTSPTLKPKLI